VQIHELSQEGETAKASLRTSKRPVPLREQVEDVREEVGRYVNSVVTHAQYRLLPLGGCGNLDLAAVAGVALLRRFATTCSMRVASASMAL
jgi:hypothetical protein